MARYHFAIMKAAAGLLALVLFGCASAPYEARMSVAEFKENQTEEATYAFEVRPRADTASMTLKVDGEGGLATWSLTDPNQAVRWEGQAQGDVKINDVRDFPAVGGTWTLRWTVKDFTGDYEVGLTAIGK